MNQKTFLYSQARIFMRLAGLFIMLFIGLSSCKQKEMKTIGSIERIDPALDSIVKPDAVMEIISEGYQWSEGTAWVESHKMLLFSDVPQDTVYKWTEEKGTEVYITPSGYTGSTPSLSKERGSNGLAIRDGKLYLCQHGDRKVAMMDATLDAPASKFVTIADNYEGKKFNSPNDLVFRSNGDIFFTDPPYGLPDQEKDATKETPFQGVYRRATDGKVFLLVDSLTRPNGIALSPDEKTLIVANSDPNKATWYAFTIEANDSLSNARIFYDATSEKKQGIPGSPDGMRIDKKGNVFATGPGGIWIFNSSGKLLGKFKVPVNTANCSLADDDKTLYIAADMNVLRIKMR